MLSKRTNEPFYFCSGRGSANLRIEALVEIAPRLEVRRVRERADGYAVNVGDSFAGVHPTAENVSGYLVYECTHELFAWRYENS